MDTFELICRVGMHPARVRHDRCLATRMPGKHTRRIVDFAIDDDPAVILCVMLLDLLASELLLRRCCLVLDSLNAILCRRLHPTPCACPRLAWVPEVEHGAIVLIVVVNFWPDDIPAVVHHSVRSQRIIPVMQATSTYPIMFQAGSLGCVFLKTLKQRTMMLSARTRCRNPTSTCQWTHVQNFFPCRIGCSGNYAPLSNLVKG